MNRKIVSTLVALCLFVSLQGQLGVMRTNPFARAASKAVYTDDFEAYSEAALVGQGNWISGLNAFAVLDVAGDNVVIPNSSYARCAAIYNDVFADNQYAEITLYLPQNTNGIGVGVRMAGSGAAFDGYVLMRYTTGVELVRYDNGAATILATATYAMHEGDVLRLEISGTTLSCYDNGSLITSLDGDGMVTDATYSSGQAGLGGRGDFANSLGARDWEGGDL